MKDISVCSRLKDERIRLKLEQKALADACDVAPKTFSRWESSIPIPADKLEALVPLGFDPLYVIAGRRMTGHRQPPPRADVAEEAADYVVGAESIPEVKLPEPDPNDPHAAVWSIMDMYRFLRPSRRDQALEQMRELVADEIMERFDEHKAKEAEAKKAG